MKSITFNSLLLMLIPCMASAAQSFYCPQNHAYINIGMSSDQVIAACGQPASIQESDQPIMQKVPMQQLIFNNLSSNDSDFTGSLNTPTNSAFYGVWNVSTGYNGVQVQVDIVDNKVKSISVNGGGSNALSLCSGANIQVGDPASKVYGACGSPNVTNNSYINVPIPSQTRPQIWIYKPDPYQPSFSLTFIDGKLQSIGNN
ncbi:DUF2845 domain-containing protein [Legionella waltersii]|uniref:DUF2845 domain-containing protein n=1 Tax=Legionella waltersii TaxID=66969 RepID=A0A0W1AMM5_9GAMM|nr:DUF2845 domain-containing protein [Legionella waltersii]KTD82613.1 hypothetical protein Lwal_0542 [Legionella waltersii]SNV07879.1 Protein of uncharacterised function (DUF2845) [Legionella waltersii]